MTICDLCLDHVKRRFKVEGNKLFYLTNLTQSALKTMTDDELLNLYKWIKDGLMVCGDCEELCRRGDRDCHTKHRSVYANRRMTDRRDLDAIENEVARRTRTRRVMRK